VLPSLVENLRPTPGWRTVEWNVRYPARPLDGPPDRGVKGREPLPAAHVPAGLVDVLANVGG
jgi:hypothetical protein